MSGALAGRKPARASSTGALSLRSAWHRSVQSPRWRRPQAPRYGRMGLVMWTDQPMLRVDMRPTASTLVGQLFAGDGQYLKADRGHVRSGNVDLLDLAPAQPAHVPLRL